MSIGDIIANLPDATKQGGSHEFFQAVLDKLAKPSTEVASTTTPLPPLQNAPPFLSTLKQAMVIALCAGILVLKPTQAFLDTLLKDGYTSVAVQMLVICIIAFFAIRRV